MEQGKIRTSDAEKAKKLAAQGANVELVDDLEEKKGKDMDGDGDIDSDDYLAVRNAAIKKAKMKKEEIEEGKAGKVAAGIAIVAALLGINKAASEKIYDSSPKVKAAVEKYEKAKKEGNKEDMAKYKEEIKKEKIKIDKGLDESTTLFEIDLKPLLEKHGKENTVKITKALMKKLHDKGEATVDGTKLVFKESHDGAGQEYLVSYQVGSWGVSKSKRVKASSPEEAIAIVTREVENDGSSITPNNWSGEPVISAKPITNEDAQLALPEPDAPNFLGDDGIDYEGGMAKSQLLKMKKYAMALCDMIEDESQLEAWVQAKLTKASDYISSVYHYLEYENQSNETPDQGIY
jgi:hypothetical protein